MKPNVEWWPQDTTVAQHIAKVGRICYKAQPKEPTDLTDDEMAEYVEKRDQNRCKEFWKSGHCSMYRHGSAYYFVKNQGKLPKWIWSLFTASPYIDYVLSNQQVWISTNMQFLCEHSKVLDILSPYAVDESVFIDKALASKCDNALMLLRMTMVVITQISTSRELNRTSPNSIAEQSTRYVNMEKKGGVQVCEPHWWTDAKMWQKTLYYCVCKVSEWAYRLLIHSGMKPQDARGVLPLDTYTVVAYTYNLQEWSHILDLRYHGITGSPHPNAYEVSKQIADLINERMKVLNPEFNI